VALNVVSIKGFQQHSPPLQQIVHNGKNWCTHSS